MYYLERLWIWITRLACCRGFGIQSPSAYSFVRYVVNEHYPYYAYADLAASFPQLGRRERKFNQKSILVVEGIGCSHHARQLWQKLRHDSRTGVTFDLHYCGLVFFDTARPKQHYVINF